MLFQTITFLVFQPKKINCLCSNDKCDKLEDSVLTELDLRSGNQSSGVCLLYSDLNQVSVSPRETYSLDSMHY